MREPVALYLNIEVPFSHFNHEAQCLYISKYNFRYTWRSPSLYIYICTSLPPSRNVYLEPLGPIPLHIQNNMYIYMKEPVAIHLYIQNHSSLQKRILKPLGPIPIHVENNIIYVYIHEWVRRYLFFIYASMVPCRNGYLEQVLFFWRC